MPLPQSGTIGEDLAALRARPSGALAIGYSGDPGLTDALLADAEAFYSVLAGFLPEKVMTLAKTVKSGNLAEVQRVHSQLRPLLGLFGELGGLRIAYAAATELGLARAAPPRPILPVSSDDRRRIAEAVTAAVSVR